MSTYLLFNLLNHPDVDPTDDSFAVMLGNDKDFLATRASYHLNLTGPSLDVQTGCSTSLVATHLACELDERPMPTSPGRRGFSGNAPAGRLRLPTQWHQFARRPLPSL